MSITPIDYILIRSILEQNTKDFVSAINDGASLTSASGHDRQSSNERLQKMINFASSLQKSGIPKEIIVTLLQWDLSSHFLDILSGYTHEELEKIIKKGKENLLMVPNYSTIGF